MLKMIFCLMLAVVANALPTDDATALPGGVEIATERGISPNEHQPLFASITPNEQCVSTTPWYNVRRIELAACSAARQRERDS